MLLQSFQIIWNIAKLKSINLQYNTVLTKYSDSLFKSGEKKFEYPDKSEMIYLKLFSKLLLIQDIVWLVLLIYWKSQVFDASKRINIIPFKKIQNNYRVFENDIVKVQAYCPGHAASLEQVAKFSNNLYILINTCKKEHWLSSIRSWSPN